MKCSSHGSRSMKKIDWSIWSLVGSRNRIAPQLWRWLKKFWGWKSYKNICFQNRFSEETALVHLLGDQLEKSRFYSRLNLQILLEQWSVLSNFLPRLRAKKLGNLQCVAEIIVSQTQYIFLWNYLLLNIFLAGLQWSSDSRRPIGTGKKFAEVVWEVDCRWAKIGRFAACLDHKSGIQVKLVLLNLSKVFSFKLLVQIIFCRPIKSCIGYDGLWKWDSVQTSKADEEKTGIGTGWSCHPAK